MAGSITSLWRILGCLLNMFAKGHNVTSIHSDEGLTLETSALESLPVANLPNKLSTLLINQTFVSKTLDCISIVFFNKSSLKQRIWV